MPDSKRFLHPEAIKRISRLDLRAAHIVEGFLSGMHRSPYFGQSIEFLQHREYVAGDDLRHVDWKVWARNDRLYVKQFEEETNLRSYLLVDVSHSMEYGEGVFSKNEYAATIAVSLAYLILKQQDAVGCLTFDDSIRGQVPLSSRREQMHAVINALTVDCPNNKTDLLGIFQKAAERFSQRGMMIVISDLLSDVEQTMRGLKIMRQRGHDILLFHVMDDDELNFPFTGPTRFEGLESEDRLNCNPQALRDGYMEAVEEFLEDVRRQTAAIGVDYLLCPTSQPMDAMLAHFLSRRISRLRGG